MKSAGSFPGSTILLLRGMATVRAGEIAQEEATQLKDEIKSRSQSFRARLDEMIEKRVEELLQTLNIPTKAEVEGLRARVEALTAQLSELGVEPVEAQAVDGDAGS